MLVCDCGWRAAKQVVSCSPCFSCQAGDCIGETLKEAFLEHSAAQAGLGGLCWRSHREADRGDPDREGEMVDLLASCSAGLLAAACALTGSWLLSASAASWSKRVSLRARCRLRAPVGMALHRSRVVTRRILRRKPCS